MSLFNVDSQKCNKDGICAVDCPLGIIQMKDGEAPTPAKGAEEICIKCGHCVAVCPKGALTHKNLSPEECIPVKSDLKVSAEQVEQLMRARRSIRAYKDTIVDKDTIKKLLELSSCGPTGHNSRSVGWTVIYDNDEVRKLTAMVVDWMKYMIKESPDMAKGLDLELTVEAYESGVDAICRNAPHVIVAHAPKTAPTAAIDCSTALAYLELAAPSFGAGTCWAGFFNVAATFWPPMQKALGLPEGHSNFGCVMIGHPKFKYHRIPPRDDAQIAWK
jgi:nitroreductase/NAD-dependent dihydropyrimidine dehydrogenase PreA subunit